MILTDMPVCPGRCPGQTRVLPGSKTAADLQEPRSARVYVDIFRIEITKEKFHLGHPKENFKWSDLASEIGNRPGHPGRRSCKKHLHQRKYARPVPLPDPGRRIATRADPLLLKTTPTTTEVS